ncbi:MAG: HAMP domain-containing histidine kinase [Jiangellaceae bacterium]|nr:HAMP domain-containing histidine kinase [Jiangellaceae bacterium]
MSRSTRALRDRLPLRTQLVVAVLVLAALAVLVTSLTAVVVLRGQLLARVDQQLAEAAGAVGRTVGRPGAQDDHPGGPRLGMSQRAPTRYSVTVFDSSGTVIETLDPQLSGDLFRPELPALDAAAARDENGEPFTVDAEQGGGNWRVLALPTRNGGAVAVGLPLDDVQATVGKLLVIDAIVGTLALALLAGAAWWAVRSSLRPLEEMEDTAEAIAAGDLAQRIPAYHRGTEVGRLAAALNVMLGHIERAFAAREASERQARISEERMRRFVADASHELRTPLTSIRGFAELYRQGAAADGADLERIMSRIESEAARMGLLVEDLLLLARLDQQRPLESAPVDLLPLASDAVHDAQAVSAEHTITLRVSPNGVPPIVLGDEMRLRQVVTNLVSNAIVHTPPGTRVQVDVGTADGNATLEVRDDGPGLAPDDAAQIFERFYRADAARSRTPTTAPHAGSGSGLGLSIVAALVAAHRGRVEVESTQDHGATFRVVLPLAPAPVDHGGMTAV